MPIDHLIINSPYEEPRKIWDYLREERRFELKDGRRSAGYVVASSKADTFDDPGVFIEIPLVNQIRKRIKEWRQNDYPGATGITKRLLRHWQDPEERGGDFKRFFFCQLEAIETLIFLTEGPEKDRLGIDIPGDGGDFSRWCSKMATGSGKTIVMAMIIAWQVLNRVADGRDSRFSKHVLVVAPGLTVKSRLSVLNPSDPDNYYDEFDIVPQGLRESLRQGQIKILNWHSLAWDTEEKLAKKKSVDETEPLPDLIKNAYVLLGKDWQETKRKWEEAGQTIPPVMITVANNTATSSRIKYSFDHDAFLLKIVRRRQGFGNRPANVQTGGRTVWNRRKNRRCHSSRDSSPLKNLPQYIFREYQNFMGNFIVF